MRHFPLILAGLLSIIPSISQPVAAQTELAPVYIEDSPDADDLVKQAQVLREQKRLTETAAMFQKIAAEHGRKLMKLDGPVFVDGVRWVRLQIAADAQLLEAYRALHEPLAARAVEQASVPTFDLSALERAAEQFALCQSGLEAALRAAGLHLERGSAVDASNLLDEFAGHADVAKHRQRYDMLQAASAIYAGDKAKLAVHLQSLQNADAVDALKVITELQKQIIAVTDDTVRSSLQVLPKVEIPLPLGTPLYVREAQTDTTTPRGPSTDPSRTRQAIFDHHMLPSVAGDMLFINTGLTLRAMDRSSLSDLWAASFSPGGVDGSVTDRFGIIVRDQAARDQRGVLVDGAHVAAVMGRVSTTGRGQVMSSSPDTLLVGVSRADGRKLWIKTVEEYDASFTQSFFHGTPVGGDGRMYVMVRRSQNSGFRDAYVLAVDIRTGSLLWKRHLSSTTPGYTSRGFSHVLADRGRLYISDNLGAVACIDASTGGMIWFHRMSKFKSLRASATSSNNAAWTMSPPIITKAGLIVSPFISGTAATLFDVKTGQKLRDLESEPLTSAAYLMPVDGDVLSVGRNIIMLDGATLVPKWTHALNESGLPVARGVVTQDRVMIPTSDKLVILNREDGKLIDSTPLESPGNLLALDGQMLITTGTMVRSHMTWPVVYANLTSRIRRNPTDAQAGLALAHAALASAKHPQALEGVDHVVAVLRHRSITRPVDVRPETDEVHAEVFQQLLRLGDVQVTRDVKTRGEIFDRIAKATVTPRDEAQYHLGFAGYLVESEWPADEAMDRRRDAARHFQTVLENPMLAGQLVPRPGGWQQGGVEARMKLAGMIDRFGRTVYEEFDDRAAEQLSRLMIGGDPDPAALIELTRQYPLAKAAGEAMLAAGEALARGGRHVDAITQLRRAYREKSASKLRPRIIGRLVDQYARIGKPLRARQWLQRAERENIQPIREGKPVAARTWLAELGTQEVGTQALPQLRATLGKPQLLAGALLLPKAQPREQWPMDRALFSMGEMTQLRGGPAFERIWEAKVEQGAELLWLNDTLVLFWVEASQTLIALDARSGKLLWQPIRTTALFKDMVANADGDPAQPRDPNAILPPLAPRGRIVLRGGVVVDIANDAPLLFQAQQGLRNTNTRITLHGQPVSSDPWFGDREVRIIINDAIACIADATGRAVGIDLDSGQVKWRFVCPFDRLDHLAISGECVAFSGGLQAMVNTETDRSIIAALDALTGEVITQVEAPGNIMWLGLSEGDGLLYVHQPLDRRETSRLVVHQLPDGQLQWNAQLTTGRIDAVTLAGESVVLLVDGTNLLIAQLLTKTVRDPISSVMIERTDNVDIAMAGEQWHLLTPQHASALKSDTQLLWRDAIIEDAGPRVLQLLGRDRQLVVTFDSDVDFLMPRLPVPQRLPDPRIQDDVGVTYRLFIIDRQSGAIEKEFQLPLTAARLDAQQAVLLNHHVLLGVGNQTMVLTDSE